MAKKADLSKKYAQKAAKKTAKNIIPGILSTTSKYVITVAGESGSGKTEIARELSHILTKNHISNVIFKQDHYFYNLPKDNEKLRSKDISIVGTGEVDLKLLDKHIKLFRNRKTNSIIKPRIFRKTNTRTKETVKCKNVKVLIIEGTYASLLKNVDKRVFLLRTYKDTHYARFLRSKVCKEREKYCTHLEKILEIEHKIISKHKKLADIIIKKNLSATEKRKSKIKPRREIKRICMLTVHGYVDPKPTLGKTDTGGQVTYVLELSKALAQKGIKIDIYTRQFQGKRTISQVCKNVRIIRIPCGGKKFIPKEHILPYLDAFVNNMVKFTEKHDLTYDIIHSHYWDAGYVAMKLSQRLSYFFVHTFHSLGAWKRDHMGGDPVQMEKNYRFKERIKHERVIFKKVRALVMTSSAMLRTARHLYSYKDKNYVTLPAGVNLQIYRPLKKSEKERRIDVPNNFIFWVGRFANNKGLDYLLRAFAETVKKEKDLFLVIGGGSKHPSPREKKLRKELHHIIDTKKLNNRVFFTRHIPDAHMPSYYRKAAFFVLPSKFEPFGMTAAEAMACGTALIVSKRSGIRRFLTNGEHCLVVNAANKKDLSWTFHVLNRNTSFRKKIARNGMKRAREQFCWTRIAEKSLAFYGKLLRTSK